jgi:hypothetical protein
VVIFGRHCNWAKVIPVVLLPLLFAGCQGLAGSPKGGDNGSVTLSSSQLDFGKVAVGGSKALQDSITNSTAASVTIASVSGATPSFQVSGISFPLVLAAGQSSSFSVQFQPSAIGQQSQTLQFLGTGAQSYASLAVSGTGVAPGALAVVPASDQFGDVRAGGRQTNSVLLSNNGQTDLTISQAVLTGTAFSMGNLVLPLTIHPGQTSSLAVTFAPPGNGSYSGNIAFTYTAAQTGGPQQRRPRAAPKDNAVNLALAGNGVPAGSLAASPTTLAFGSVQVGSNASLSETVTNTGGSTVTISQANISNAAYSLSGLTLPASVGAGQSITFTVKFAPSAAGLASGNLTLVSDAANSPLTIPLSGTGVTPGNLTANPTSLAFGNVQVGSNASLSETVTNTGGSTVTISSASLSNAAYSISGLTLPANLTAGQSVTFTVTFAPSATGSVTANLTLVSNAGNSPLVIGLSGTGTAPGQLGVSPASLSFGDVVVGANSILSASLNATGATVTVSSATSTSSEFTINGLSLPAVIGAGQSLPYSVTFTPQASGTATATLTFVSNASNSPTQQTATGNGLPPSQHSVSLSWNASGSQGVLGYNLYRGGVSGGPYSQINTSLDVNTNYTDDQVVAGQTYYYVATAVDGNGLESGYSNEAQAVIPQP